MIDHQDVISSFRTELLSKFADFTAPLVQPLPVSVFVAASLLQKAVRRGDVERATSAAATLLVNDPDRLWRRLGGIAFEDIGLADPCAVGFVTSMLGGKRVRASLGGEWRVAALLVRLLAEAPKCRAADDLLMAIEMLPALSNERAKFADLSYAQLRLIALGTGCLHERALAVAYLTGTNAKPSPHLAVRKGEPAFAFDLLDELGAPFTVVALAREGFRRTREMLCPLWGFLAAEGENEATIGNDVLPPTSMAGPVPGWALDGYTREGRLAIARFLGTKAGLAEWTRHRLQRGERVQFVAQVLFHVEGGLLLRRRRTQSSDELRRINEEQCLGVTPDEARECMALMRDGLPLLNAIRAEIMEGQAHA